MYPDREFYYMKIAMKEAQRGLERDNLPVGAVLVIGKNITGTAFNTNYEDKSWNGHAENNLINRYATEIYQARRNREEVAIFTTLEPCFMCLGSSVLNRINKIVYACPDPRGGTSSLKPEQIGPVYVNIWPSIQQDERFKHQSYNLLIEYMNVNATKWDTMLNAMQEMRSSWD